MLLTAKANEMFKAFKAAGVARVKVSRRNKKLVPNKRTAFVIFNLPAVVTCPNATPLCLKYCYARKAETAYPTVLPARIRNYNDSLAADFVPRMVFTILSARKYSKADTLLVRIHESGDFYSKEYAEKWMEIARQLKGEKVKFIAYTKSFAFFDGVTLPDNFFLRASVWADTPASDLEIIARNGWTIYTAVEKFQTGDAFTRCRCADCASCGFCWSKRADIRCEIH